MKEHAESELEQYVYKTITDLDQEEQDPYIRLSSSQAQGIFLEFLPHIAVWELTHS